MSSTPNHVPTKLTLLALFAYSLSGNALAEKAEKNEAELIEVHAKKSSMGLNLKGSNTASNRLGLDIIKIPGSVEVISKEDIAIKADYSSLSTVTRATGFASSASPGNGGTSMSVRGFNGHGAVVQTYDGTRLYVGAGTVTFPADTWTLEKVEVLRGPGSVTNGVGAIGGTVNYAPKAPTFDAPSSEIDVTAGSFGLRRVAFGSGGAVTDNVAYRFDAVNHETEGYVDRADEKRQVAAASLLFRPQDNLDIKFSIDYADIDAAPYWGTPLVSDDEIDSSTRKNNYNVKDGLVEYEDIWPRVEINWKINDLATLENDTYYLKAKRHWRNVESYSYNKSKNEVNRSFYLEILHDQKQIGNRSNLLLDFDIAGLNNRLSVGAEINKIDFTHTNNRNYDGNTPVNFDDPTPGTWAEGVESPTSKDFSSDTLQYAFFIDNVLQINEELSLVAGLRRDKIDYEREDFFRINNTHQEDAEETDDSFHGSSWRLGMVYQPLENTSFYLQTSKAVDSIQSIITASSTDVELAEGKQVELGLKQSFWNDRLQYTIAIYDIEKENLLNTYPGDVESQIGKQTSRGVEVELFIKPTETFDIDFNIARVNPEYEDFIDSGDNFSANTPRNVPNITANLWMNWQPIDRWLLSGGARYVGKRYADDANETTMPSYTVFDASIQWKATQDLQLTLRGKNLTDEEDYVLSPYDGQWILADGRSAEVSLNYSF